MNNRKLFVSVMCMILVLMMVLGLLAMAIPAGAKELTSDKLEQLKEDIEYLEGGLGELKSDRTALKKRLKELAGQVKENMASIQDIVDQRDILDEQVGLLYMEIENINQQIQKYNRLIATKQEELDIAEEELEALNQQYKDRIRAMEENGDISFWSVLFKANSFTDLLDRMNMIREIEAADQRRIAEIQAKADEVAAARNVLELEKAQLETIKAEQIVASAELEVKSEQAQALMDKLIAEGNVLQDLVDDFEDQEAQVLEEIKKQEEAIKQAEKDAEAELERLEEEERKRIEEERRKEEERKRREEEERRKKEEEERKKKEELLQQMQQNGQITNTESKWMVPCKYTRLTSPWGMRWHPVDKVYKMHHGVDLANAKGTPIYATKSGIVSIASKNSGYGFYVKIDHGSGYQSLYAHMTHYVVKQGQVVVQGQIIGYMGSTGKSTGPHLHFAIYKNGESVNPMDYIGK